MIARLTAVKTLAGFGFSFQPLLDRNRILTLAQLGFIRPQRGGPCSRPARHRQVAPGGGARRRRRSKPAAASTSLPSLAKAEREGCLRERICWLTRAALLIIDEIGYLPVIPGGGNLIFQLVNARYEKGAMILTSNAASPSGAKCSATRSSPPRCSVGSSTTPSSSRSRVKLSAAPARRSRPGAPAP